MNKEAKRECERCSEALTHLYESGEPVSLEQVLEVLRVTKEGGC